MSDLQIFLYVLMRDHVPPGAIVDILRNHVATTEGDDPVYTNKPLAEMARVYARAIFSEGEINYD